MTWNPFKVSSLVHRTLYSVNLTCITLPECSRCVAFQIHCVTGALIRLGLVPKFWFLCSLFLDLFRSFAACNQYTSVETPSFLLFHLHYVKNCKCFCVFWFIFSSPLQRSSVIVLSFLDLKVSQVLFSVIKENLIVLDSRLHCYSCIWSELVVFLVSKASFQFQITKCCYCPHLALKRNLLVIVTLKNNSDLCISFHFIIYILRRMKKNTCMCICI